MPVLGPPLASSTSRALPPIPPEGSLGARAEAGPEEDQALRGDGPVLASTRSASQPSHTAEHKGDSLRRPSREGSTAPTHYGEDLRRLIASTLIEVPVGSRLPTVRELAARHGASRSSVQLALARLEQEGAVKIDRRGRLGATLVWRSLATLWSVGQGGPFVAALPLPSTRRIQGLATGIRATLADVGIESFMIFLREPRERLRAVEQGRCHVAVMSSLDAEELRGEGSVVQVLAPGTYAEEHRVFMSATPHWDRVLASGTDIPILAPEDLAVVGPHGEPAISYTEVRLDPEDVRQVKNRHLRVALVWAYAHPFFEALTAGIAAECERLGIEIVASSDYGSRASNMKDAVAAVLSHGPDMLLTICMDPETGGDACRLAVEAGVKIVFLSSLPKGFVAGRDCVGMVTGDQYAMGRGAADMLAESMGQRGSIGMIYWGGPFQVQNLRDQIAKTVLVREYPAISIVAEGGATSRDEAEGLARTMIAEHPEIEGIYAAAEEAAEGVLLALRASGRPDVKVTTVDLGPNTLLDMVRGGNIQGLAVEYTVEMGATMVREAALAVLGKPVPAFTVVNALNITRVAVDRDSATARRLAGHEFPDRLVELQLVQLLPVTYPQLLRMFQDGEIRVAIWDTGEEHDLLPTGTTSRPLSDRVRAQVGDRPTRAALVTRSEATSVRAVIRECVDGARLLSVQEDVVAETRSPEY